MITIESIQEKLKEKIVLGELTFTEAAEIENLAKAELVTEGAYEAGGAIALVALIGASVWAMIKSAKKAALDRENTKNAYMWYISENKLDIPYISKLSDGGFNVYNKKFGNDLIMRFYYTIEETGEVKTDIEYATDPITGETYVAGSSSKVLREKEWHYEWVTKNPKYTKHMLFYKAYACWYLGFNIEDMVNDFGEQLKKDYLNNAKLGGK